MNARGETSGIVLQCNPSGEILRIIRDDLGLTAGHHPPSTLFGLVDAESQEKARGFLRAAIEGHATFGWELNVHYDGQLTGLLLTGGLTNEGIIVSGSTSRSGSNSLFDEMMKIQNEQLNVLRMQLKKKQLEAAMHCQREQQILNDFTSLNNSLVNTQRELARRNADLADANLRLQSLATTDGLTGLKNHREFQESLAREHDRAARHRTALSLLMLDVDHFKQFNDQFGHPEGDRVLKQVAQILTVESRSDALVARYGGEEFALILPNCGREGAAGAAERVRRAVEREPWDLRPITVSLGTATMDGSSLDCAALIALADAGMYRAKVNGRNQVGSVSDACVIAPAEGPAPLAGSSI
jgi:diguanylate cyclase (GGDEF)-like protein